MSNEDVIHGVDILEIDGEIQIMNIMGDNNTAITPIKINSKQIALGVKLSREDSLYANYIAFTNKDSLQTLINQLELVKSLYESKGE